MTPKRRPREKNLPENNNSNFGCEDVNRLANAAHTLHLVIEIKVIGEEDPGAGLPPPGGHRSPSVRDAVSNEKLDFFRLGKDAVLNKKFDFPVSVGTLREVLDEFQQQMNKTFQQQIHTTLQEEI